MNPAVTKKTLIYKTIPSPVHELKLDVYYPSSTSSNPLPILLRLHGGGLVQGNRSSVPPHLLNGIQKHEYILISADYRLAPQTALPSILSDVLDCLTFVRTELPSRMPQMEIFDTTRIALLGSSAGGYLALLAAVYANPKPAVVLVIYPITNPFGSFFARPQPLPLGRIERSVVAPFLDKNGEVTSDPDPASERSKMYHYVLQEALLPKLIGVQECDEKYIVSQALKKNGEKLPPIYIVHGDEDRWVGIEQTDEVVQALEQIGAVFEYDKVKGADHLFDRAEAIELTEMYKFMKRYLICSASPD